MHALVIFVASRDACVQTFACNLKSFSSTNHKTTKSHNATMNRVGCTLKARTAEKDNMEGKNEACN